MEARLSTKIKATSKAVNEAVKLSHLTNDALEALEDKVNQNDEKIRESLARNQTEVMMAVKVNLKDMVNEQLRQAGFDLELSAGMMETPVSRLKAVQDPSMMPSYSAIASGPRKLIPEVSNLITTG